LSVMVKSCLSRRPHVVIFLAPNLLAFLFLKLSGIRIVRYQGGLSSKQTENQLKLEKIILSLFSEQILFALSDRIIIESLDSMPFQDLDKWRSKVRFATMYVDKNLFKFTRQFSDREFSIGYVGSLEENKGMLPLFEAFLRIKEYLIAKNAKILVCGGGSLLPALQAIASQNGLSHLIFFKEWVDHKSVSEILNNLQLLLLPSYSEGLPNVIIEALACATPVLATSVGSIPSVIKDGETGFLLESNEPALLGARIIELLNKPDLLKRASQIALKFVNENYSFETVSKTWSDLFEEFCD
jgi:glycosyltransferase involved in cell wall biosynthesis